MRGTNLRCLSLLCQLSRKTIQQKTRTNNQSFSTRSHHQSGSQSRGYPRIVFAGLLGLMGIGGKPEEDDPITSTIKSAILCIQRGDFVAADKLLHVALKQAQVSRHEEAVTHIYCLMANLALERSLLNQAEKLFTTVLQRLLSEGEAEDSNAVLEISLKIAKIFQAKGENKKAEQGFNYCVDKQRRKLADMNNPDEDSLALLGMSLDWQAQFYLSISNLTKAESVWREALEVGKKLHGDDDEQILVVTNSLATVVSMQEGRETEAAIILEDLVNKADRIQSGLMTTFLVNLGLVRMKQGLYDIARSKCEGARRMAEAAGDQEVSQEANNCLDQVKAVMAASVHNR